jgi:hypothetical protein
MTACCKAFAALVARMPVIAIVSSRAQLHQADAILRRAEAMGFAHFQPQCTDTDIVRQRVLGRGERRVPAVLATFSRRSSAAG